MDLKGVALRTRDQKIKELEIRKDSLSNALTGIQTDSLVYMPMNGTNTQHKSMKKTLEKDQTQEISQQLTLMKSPTMTYSQADFLASLSALLGSGKDLKIHEALSSLISQGYSIPKDLECAYLKMSRDFFHTITEIPSGQYSGSCMNWGMTFNGRCLTARISESHRIGKECSLSDILEEHPDQKYFLSEEAVKKIKIQAED